MANWCMNWVTVEGKEDNISSLMYEVNALSVKANVEDVGVRPSDEGNLQYMFFIYVNDGYSFSFESKWSPANDSLQFLAKMYQVTIINRYSELGNMVFGQWTGDGEIEEDVWLTDEEWELAVPGDEDDSYYTYEGKKYENEEEILDIILDNKIKKLKVLLKKKIILLEKKDYSSFANRRSKLEIYKNLLAGLDKLLIEVLFEEEFPEMTEDDKNGLEIVIHHAIGTNTFDIDGDFYESKEDYIRSKAALQMLKLTKEYFDSLENE